MVLKLIEKLKNSIEKPHLPITNTTQYVWRR